MADVSRTPSGSITQLFSGSPKLGNQMHECTPNQDVHAHPPLTYATDHQVTIQTLVSWALASAFIPINQQHRLVNSTLVMGTGYWQ